jgi:3-oxoacyl-[acyl-carrier protein] reductase
MLEGKTAFVTGGSRGIGAAIVRKLAAAGAAVTFTYNSSPDAARAVAEAAGNGAQAVRLDLADADAVAAAVRGLPKLDILVNNAGTFELAPVAEATLAAFDRMFAVNVRAVVAAVLEAAKIIPDGGRIITVGSVNGEAMPFPGGAFYAGSKGAVRMLTKGWTRDLGDRGVTVNVVQPGPVDTDLNPADGPFGAVLTGMTALKRYGKPEDVAELVAFLAGPAGGNITGAALITDGGMTA